MKDRTRKIALDAINDITRNKSYGNLAIKTSFIELSPQEKRFATRLVYGTVEKLITIDWIIANYVKKHTPATLKNILRMGTYQIYYMDSVPTRAACDTSVELANVSGKGGASGFINAVLRNIVRGKEKLILPTDDMSIMYSCPKWIVDMWIKQLGKETTECLLQYVDNKHIVVRANTLKGYTNERLEDELKKRGIKYTKGEIIKDAYKVKASFEQLDKGLFDVGLIAIQDEGSMLIAKIATDDKPKTVLDACAAPGGKTATMASMLPSAKYYATDIHKHRVELMEKQLKRLGVDAKIYRFDASEKPFELEVDCVLIDAPCSGLGTMFKQPDIKYNKSYDDIKSLHLIQLSILSNCAKSVVAGGNIIYSTCTIAKRENQEVIEKFLEENKDFEVVDINSYVDTDSAKGDIGIQLLPHVHNTVGFYICKMRKTK